MTDAPTRPTLALDAKRPRKDEIRSAIKLLRSEAAKQRNYAMGDDKRVETSPFAADFLKWAARHRANADRWEKVALWMEAMCNDR